MANISTYFESKVVFITGAGGGLGKALALQLGKFGSKVIVTDINLTAAEQVAEIIQTQGGSAYTKHLDVTNREQFAAVLEDIFNQEGTVDIIINNAGVAAGGEFQDLSLDNWDRINKINYEGMLVGTKLAYDRMISQRSGQIVNLSSVYGQVPSPMTTPYAATKAAVFAFTRSLRWEAKHYGIKINTVTPGYIDTMLIENGTYAKISHENAISVLPFKMISAEKAADKILNGIRKNKAVIAFPWYVRIYWWLYRCSPWLLGMIYSHLMKDFRKKKEN